MSTWAIGLSAFLYLLTSIDLWQQKHIGLSLTFVCYALANVGLILAARRI